MASPAPQGAVGVGSLDGRFRSKLGPLLAAGAVMGLLFGGCASGPTVASVPSLPAATSTSILEVEVPSTTTVPSEPEIDGIRVAAGEDIQAAVELADEGAIFILESGVHRLQEVEPKSGMTFVGQTGTVLSGAVVLEGWVREDDVSWSVDGYEETIRRHGTCIEGYEGCKLTQDLFIDDVMLWQVTDKSDLGPGRWYWEGNTILIGDDPLSRRVELSVAEYAFRGDAAGVMIRDLVVEKYAVPAQYGAITAATPGDGPLGSDWVIADSEIRLNHGAGVRLGERTVARNLFVHHNGQLGITASGGDGSVVQDCEISHNNTAGFKWGWEAGGSKFKETRGLTVRGNFVHNNEGPGLWTDINNYDTLYENNTVTDNSGPGIFHEISYAALIRSNTVTGNGFGWDPWLWGSGILVAASSDVEIYGNEVTGNADGIAGIQQDRGDGPEGPRLLQGMYAHSNTISVDDGHTGIGEDTGDSAVFTDRDNRFESNTYVDTSGRRYHWGGRSLDAAGWRNEGQDVSGTWR